MPQQQKDKREHLFNNKKNLLVYSLFIALGSVSLFISLNMLYIVFQAYLWNYSIKYILNSLTTSFVLLLACIFFIISCFQIIKNKTNPYNIGTIGCILLIVYPLYILFIDTYTLSFSYYVVLMIGPALIALFVTLTIESGKK
ncbi:MAG: hypothetical protein R6V50_05660 [Thermoplasmatota archaeon]